MQLRQSLSPSSEVEHWWRRIKARHQVFFHLMNGDTPSEQKLSNLDGFIQQLEHTRAQLADGDYPTQAESIRQHLLNAVHNLLESLHRLRDRQAYASDVRFDLAQVDYSMVQHELLQQRIVD